MQVISVVSQKGGSGKTTLTGHLAVQAERAGDGPVAIIDTDPQGSLSAWWNAREAETPVFSHAYLPNLRDCLEELRFSGVSLVVVDTPPAITGAIEGVIALSDHVIIPTRPSPHDLRAVGATVALARRHDKPMVFVVNDASVRARITYEAAVALSQHGTVAPVTLHHRTDFASSRRSFGTGDPCPVGVHEVAHDLRRLPTGVPPRFQRRQESPALDLSVGPGGHARPPAAHRGDGTSRSPADHSSQQGVRPPFGGVRRHDA